MTSQGVSEAIWRGSPSGILSEARDMHGHMSSVALLLLIVLPSLALFHLAKKVLKESPK